MRRRFQFDLGTLLWLIAILCASLAGIPAMLETFGQSRKITQREPWFTKGDPAKRPFSTRERTAIILSPSGARFDVRQDWLSWHDQYANNFHLSRRQLDKVARGEGEWDTEYASVANAVLPFDRCCAHVGDEGWGRRAVSYGDLQMRVYDLDDETETVEKRIESDGVADVRRFSGKRPLVEVDREGAWRQTTLSFDRFYDDYGATANVDFRVQRFGNRTFVFVFMYTDYGSQAEVITSILNSFKPATTNRQ